MNDNTRQEPTLVLNGTGKIGRRVVERLTARGLPVRIGSRSGEPRFDWEDRSTWGPVLEGVGSAYVSHQFDAIPGAAETLGSVAELAMESGVPRLVLMSGRGEKRPCVGAQAVRDSGAELTVLHSTWFAQNFSEDYWQAMVQAGEVALPAGDTPEPFVDADDIADVAVAALTDDRHIGEVYEPTGPRLLTFANAVREISRAVGREIRYVPISIEDSRPPLPSRPFRARSSRCWPTSSVRSSTAATPAWPTACSAPSAASRGTSATTHATRPPPASGTRGPPGPHDVTLCCRPWGPDLGDSSAAAIYPPRPGTW